MSLFFVGKNDLFVRVYRAMVFFIAVIIFTAAQPCLAQQETGDYVHFRLGVKYRNENKPDLAIEAFNRVLSVYPDNYNAYMHLGEIFEKQGRLELATFHFKKALTYNPGWAQAHRSLARVHEANRRIEDAVREWQDYLAVCDPEERDSIQAVINRLVVRMRDKSGVGLAAAPDAPAGTGAASQAAADGKAAYPSSSTAPRMKRTLPAGSSPAAAEEFKKAALAYDEAVAANDSARFSDALMHVRNTLKLEPGHAGAYYYAGLVRHRNREYDLAKINFEKAVDYPEMGHGAHYYLGRIYGEEKQYSKAIAHLKLFVQKTDNLAGRREAQTLIDRYSGFIAAKKADTLTVNVRDITQAALERELSVIPPQRDYAPIEIRLDSLLTMMIVDTISDAGQAMLAGVRAYHANRFDVAIETFKKAMAAFPGKKDIAASCMYDIGVCLFRLRNYRGAEEQFQQVLDRYPAHGAASRSLYLKALSYLERGESQRAEKLFRDFIQQYRTHAWVPRAYEKLGDAYTDLDEFKKAADAYTEAAGRAASPLDAVFALFKLGETWLKIDNPQRAVEAFSRVIEKGERAAIYERVPDAYYRLADYYYRQGAWDKAMEKYVTVTRKYAGFQDTPWGLFQIGSIYKNQKKFDKSLEIFKTLIETYADDYWAQQAQWKMKDAIWENEYRAVLQ